MSEDSDSEDSDYTSSEDGSGGSSNCEAHDDDDEPSAVMEHQEITAILPRRSEVQASTAKGKKSSKSSKPRDAAIAAGETITEQVTGKRKRRSKKTGNLPSNKENMPAEIPAPPRVNVSADSFADSSTGDAASPRKMKQRNFIYDFFTPVEVNPARSHSALGDKHYMCRHIRAGHSDGHIITVTARSNNSINGLVTHLRNHFPRLHALYEAVRVRRPAQPLPLEIRIARNEVSLDNAAVEANLNSIQAQANDLLTGMENGVFNQDKFERYFSEWMVIRNQPFEEADQESLRRMLQYVHGAKPLHVPSSSAIRRRVLDLRDESIEQTCALIKEITGMFSLSLDAWTSSNGYAFLAIVLHYVNEDWELEECLIDFRELLGEHSGENLAAAVWDTLELYGLKGRIMAVNCDNASNNDTLMDALERCCKSVGIPFSAQVARMRCMPHTIHLAAMQLLETIGAISGPSGRVAACYQEAITTMMTVESDNLAAQQEDSSLDAETLPLEATSDVYQGDSVAYAVEKLRKIVRAVRSSPQRRAVWLRIARMSEPSVPVPLATPSQASSSTPSLTPPGTSEASDCSASEDVLAKMLILDVRTRWSSTHQMLQRALEFRTAINLFVLEAKDSKIPLLSESDWTAIELVEGWLRRFRKATTQMSMTSAMTLSSVHAIFRDLQDHLRSALETLPLSAPSGLKEGLINAHTKLSNYYLKVDASPYYVWAALLDPRISLSGLLQDVAEDPDSDEQIMHIRACKARLEEHYRRHYGSAMPGTATTLQAPLSASSSFSDGDDIMARYRAKNVSATADELERYFKLDTADAHASGVSALTWWRDHSGTFPNLSRLVRDLFSIPGCAVAVERIFSSARDTIALRRASLKPETIRSLMLLRQQILLARRKLRAQLFSLAP